MNYKSKLALLISKHIDKEISEELIEIPPNPKLGDFAFPCFNLAKILKKAPAVIASELVQELKADFISEIKPIGPYVNFFVKKKLLAKKALTKIYTNKDKYGSDSINEGIMIESPSPNTNKPLHLGHVRNMLLGNSIVNLYKKIGYDAKRVEIVNDRGVHICKSMLAYQKFGNNKEPDKKSDHFVGDYYVLYNTKEKETPEFKDEIQEMLVKWENNDEDVRTLWKKMNNWATKGFKETYNRYGADIDEHNYESDFYELGRDIVLDAFDKGLLKKDENKNIYYSDNEVEKKIVLRGDGTTIYMTQDMALANIRYNKYKIKNMVYVVASEQNHHFKVLFKIFKMLNREYADHCYHLGYGMIYLPEGKMKSREGTVVDADSMANDIHNLAKNEIVKRYPDLNPKIVESRAESIGMGAIKFFILKYDSMKDFVFDPKESLSFEGETGPYVQYTHARCASVLKKHGRLTNNIDFSKLDTVEDKKILKLLENLPETVKKAALEYKPSLITRLLLDLCQAFNEYYHKHQILNDDDKELEKARILLVNGVKQVLAIGLNLLGIDALDEM
jgi:arginyl-tRNA synthetase